MYNQLALGVVALIAALDGQIAAILDYREDPKSLATRRDQGIKDDLVYIRVRIEDLDCRSATRISVRYPNEGSG